jgi:5'-methylthioadenosine phosphorylase
MWAVIGGTGFEKFDGFKTLGELDRNTPFGKCSSGFKKVQIGETEVLFMSRHGVDHELLPSEINYRANIFALKKYGATKVLSFSAVGSLRRKFSPGDLVVPNQFIDRTKSIRPHTFCGEGVVGHVSLAEPVTVELIDQMMQATQKIGFEVHYSGVYLCIEGPAFSTRAESKYYRSIGADIIGMTGFPEYALAREAGLCYLPCCFITDYDSWEEELPHVTLDEVIAVMRANNEKAFHLLGQLMKKAASAMPQGCPELGLKTALMTPWHNVPDKIKPWLEVLVK